jgi:hypothetical protein
MVTRDEQEPEHAYPSGDNDPRVRGAPPALVAAFSVMNHIKPGAISDAVRFYMAAVIVGLIERAYEQGRAGKPLQLNIRDLRPEIGSE